MKNILMVIVFSVCIYFVKIAYWSVTDFGDDAYTDDPVAIAAEEDAWVEEDLAEGGQSDAAHWLKQKGNVLFEGNAEETQALIDGLYRDGAVNVWFTGIEKLGKVNVSASIAVELPSDAASRQAIFQREADYWGSVEYATEDVGQQYLSFYFD